MSFKVKENLGALFLVTMVLALVAILVIRARRVDHLFPLTEEATPNSPNFEELPSR